MLKLFALFTIFLFFTIHLKAQYPSFSGNVIDTVQNKGVQNAVVALLTPKDSILCNFTRTDASGHYVLKNVKPGNYIIMTSHPYFADVIDNVDIAGMDKVLAPTSLTSKSKLLQEVIVKSGNPIRIKGDTTIYTADSFKVSANANVEELLKKLPGIQVDKNGKITAMGEQVTKVLVDGEEFFGDDPGMAVKNLRADAVKEVQVFDKKSDQSEFTGIDDGKTQKTINLKLKEDRKKGYFGKIDLSGGLLKGIDDRYNNNILLSSFKGKRKISGFLLTGNTGQDGLNWQDSDKYGGENENVNLSVDDDGNLNYQWTGGNTDNEPSVNTSNGFIKNINAGIQYSNKWNDKQTLNFSPKFNSQDYTNTQQIYRQTLIADSVINQQSTVKTHVNRYNFKTSGTYDVKLDSFNSAKITVKGNLYHTESEEEKESASTGGKGSLKNTSDNNLKTNSDKQSFYTSLLLKHKFKKPRRTISLSTDWNILNTNGTNFLQSFNQTYNSGIPVSTYDIKQQRNNDQSGQKLGARISYSEPLGPKYSMELAYEFNANSGKNDQVTYTYSPVTGKYDQQVDSLTNNFKQSILINKPSFAFSYNSKKVKFRLGSGFGITHFDLKDNSLMKDYIRNYTNFFPAASLTYTYKAQHSLRIFYNGNTSQPTINQLQPLRNNNDHYNQILGNPSLKPSFTNAFGFSHNSYNFLKDMFIYQSFNVRLTSNAITNSRIINVNADSTITQPVNTNGNLNLNFYAGTGFKVKKLDTRFYIGPSLYYSKAAELINNQLSYSKTTGFNITFDANKFKEKKYEFNLSDNFNYNSNSNSQSSTNNHYFTNTIGMEATIFYHKTWSLNTNWQFVSRQKTPQINTNLNTQIGNASLQKTINKDEFTIYFKVRDILNQNIGIERSYYSNTFSEERNDRLKRYWLLGFAWNFKNKGGAAK